jgi:hypothetical protein
MQKEINKRKAELEALKALDVSIQIEIDKIYQKYADSCTKITKHSDLFGGKNCESLELGDVDTIFGPCNFDYYVMGDKKFYIFGEAHGKLNRDYVPGTYKHKPSKSLIFSSFVYSLVTREAEIPKNYDLFIEYGLKDYYENEDIQSKSEALDLTRSQFKDCLFPRLRAKCNHKNLRIHATDARVLHIAENYFAELHAQWNVREQSNPQYITYYISFVKDMLKHLLGTLKVQKQFNQIDNKELKEALLRFFEHEINSISTEKHITYDRLIEISTFIMDIYCMPRLLRDFKTNPNRPDINSQFKENSNNIIYYAGRLHTERFKKFMLYIGVIPILSIGNKTCHKSHIDINQAFLDTFN